MNKVFKIVFNAARGKMMVVNEATSSVQTGKKAAVTVAVIGALASGCALAATSYYPDSGFTLDTDKTFTNVYIDGDLSKKPLTQFSGKTGNETLTFDYSESTAYAIAARWSGPDVTISDLKELNVTSTSNFGHSVLLAIGNNPKNDSVLTLSNIETINIGTKEKALDTGVTINVQDMLNMTGIGTLNVYASGNGIWAQPHGANEGKANIEAEVINIQTESSAVGAAIYSAGGEGYESGVALHANEINIESTEAVALSMSSAGSGKTSIALDAESSVNVKGKTLGVNINRTATNDYGSSLSIISQGDISIEGGDGAVNLFASQSDSKLTSAISAKTNVTVSSESGFGIKADNVDLTVAANNIDISAATNGIDTSTGASVNLSANATTISAGNYGIYAKSGSTLELTGTSLELSAARAGVVGWGADVTLGSESTDYVKVNVAATDKTKADAKGIWSYDEGTKVTVNGKQLDVNVDGQGVTTVYGIYVQGDINSDSDDNGAIVINAEKTNVEVKGGTGANVGLCTMAEGTLIVNGDLAVSADLAIVTRGHSVIDINASGDNTVKLDGDIYFAYDGNTSGTAIDSTVNLNLSNSASYLKGNIIKSDVSGNKGEVTGMTLGLSNGATWYATKDSFANVLTLNDGIVDIQGGTTVTIDTEAKGTGTIALGSDNDFFKVTGTNNLDSLTVTQAGATADTMSADQAEQAAKDLMDNVDVGDTVAKTFVVAEGEVGGEIVVGADGTAEQAVNTKTEALADKVWLAPNMITRIMMNDVRKRMGDLRAAEGTHGVWARYNGGQMSGSGVDADFSMVQVGIDTVPVVDAPRFGVAFSYAETEAKDNLGTTDMDSFSLAFYGTKMYDNGMFVDVIGRMATMDSDIVNAGAKGKMDNVALSLSGELGWRFDVTDRFFFEPSVEATYTYTNADTFTMTNGGKYELEAMDSLVGRAGFAAGFKCPANKGDVYVRAAVVHEFMGDATINSWTANGAATPIESDGKDTWFEYAIGAQFNVNKNTYVYADIERTEGATMDEDWRANVGVRFAF